MKLAYFIATTLALLLTACAPEPAADLPAPAVSTAAPQVEAATEAPPAATPAGDGATAEVAMRLAETEAADEALRLATEEAMQVAETEQAAQPTAAPPEVLSGAFVKEEVLVTGSYTLDPATGQLVFSEDFLVSTGPALHVILSGASDLTVDYVTFSQMVTGAAYLELGALAAPEGAQTYTVPQGTDLTQFNTVVIWCADFDVAFAAAALSGQ